MIFSRTSASIQKKMKVIKVCLIMTWTNYKKVQLMIYEVIKTIYTELRERDALIAKLMQQKLQMQEKKTKESSSTGVQYEYIEPPIGK